MNREAIAIAHFFQKHNGLYPVSDEVVADACKHALEEFPRESCGIVAAGQYHRVPNTSENPNSEFAISLADQLSVCQPEEIEAVIHSHPAGVEGPTISDMVSQSSAGVPFGIVVLKNTRVEDVIFYGDTVRIAPLINRPFKAGVYDCYSLVRDKFRIDYGITLMDGARDPDWWLNPDEENLLVDRFREAGFEEISDEEIREGDCFLSKPFRVPKICHCGVYEGNGLVLHHFGSPNSQRLSVRESIYTVRPTITHWLRHREPIVQPSAS